MSQFLVPVLDGAATSGGRSSEGHSLLSGCALPAWSAVIHRPAEDSEPDELPSTVDMDAIKVRTKRMIKQSLSENMEIFTKVMRQLSKIEPQMISYGTLNCIESNNYL